MVLYLGLYNKVGSWNKTWRVALSGVTLFEGGPVLARAEVHPPGACHGWVDTGTTGTTAVAKERI